MHKLLFAAWNREMKNGPKWIQFTNMNKKRIDFLNIKIHAA